jgi:hypothetical protein
VVPDLQHTHQFLFFFLKNFFLPLKSKTLTFKNFLMQDELLQADVHSIDSGPLNPTFTGGSIDFTKSAKLTETPIFNATDSTKPVDSIESVDSTETFPPEETLELENTPSLDEEIRLKVKEYNKLLGKEEKTAAVDGLELFIVHNSSAPIPATFNVLRNKCAPDGGEHGQHQYFYCTNQEGLLELLNSLIHGENNE